jgi:hypothetical protein
VSSEVQELLCSCRLQFEPDYRPFAGIGCVRALLYKQRHTLLITVDGDFLAVAGSTRRSNPMKVQSSPRFLAIACVLILCTQASVAQTTFTQVFSAVDTRTSELTANYTTPDTYNTTTLSLTCSVSPIVATLSGPLMNSSGTAPQLASSNPLLPGGNLLVDNNIFVSVTPQGGTASVPVNVCPATNYTAPGEGLYTNNCFTSAYVSAATAYNFPPGPLGGQDPDTYELGAGGPTVDYAGGVPPIDISSLLVSGQQNLTIAEEDEGGVLTASSIFLTTNCTVEGVTGPATISGNTIASGTSPQGLTQTFNFSTGLRQLVGFVYDLSTANTENTLNENTNGAIPQTSDAPLDPTTFQPDLAPGTSFATSNCLIHTGELLPNGNPACKLYTLECFTQTNTTPAGAQCPVSSVANEVVEDIFDGPAFTLNDILTPDGRTFHEGIGLLMASETWSASDGGNCTFDPASGLVELPCPQNLITSFSGPGKFGNSGQTTNPNSTFISVYGVPEDRTWVYVAGERPDHWVNTSTPKVHFRTEAPNFTKGAWIQNGNKLAPLPGAAKFIPAPIQSITYGLSTPGSVPLPINEPIMGDTVLQSKANCAGGHFTAPTVPYFVPPAQTLPSMPDGHYLLHYYAKDCAGTQELLFTQAANPGSWSTNFYTYPINIDTTPPVVNGPVLPTSAPFRVGSLVYATYSCTDATSGSGVVRCGGNFYAPETTYNTGTLKDRVDTRLPGPHQFTVFAVDGAGNSSSQTVSYTVTR